MFTMNDVEIIEETPEYLVINKPAGLTVHGTKFVKGKTLVDVLLPKYPELTKIGEDPDRPGVVHRIDREVSGLMVVPRTQDSFDNIKEQFQKRTVNKNYTALVYEAIHKKEDEINDDKICLISVEVDDLINNYLKKKEEKNKNGTISNEGK